MEAIVIVVIVVVVIGFLSLGTNLTAEKQAQADYQKSKAERERAEREREEAAHERSTALVAAATDRAVMLERMKQEAERNILAANQQSLAAIYNKIDERGGLQVGFELHPTDTGIVAVKANWEWNPFDNAVLKIYRNEGSIVEDPAIVVQNCQLIFIANGQPVGEFLDKDTRAGVTYNYYAFLEVRHTGFKPSHVRRGLPAALEGQLVLDNNGNEVTSFETVEPEAYEETIYHGFRTSRITIEEQPDEFQVTRRALDKRQKHIELKKYEEKIARMEEEMELETKGLTDDTLANLLDRAKAKSAQRKQIEQLIESIEADPDLDAEEKEELAQEIIDRFG